KNFSFKLEATPGKEAAANPSPFPFPVVPNCTYLHWSKWDAAGLTTLVLKWINLADRLPLSDLRQILLTCQDTLCTFEYAGVSPYSAPDDVVIQVTLPALERLTLAYLDSFSHLVQLMHVPNVKSLSLRDLFFSPDKEQPIRRRLGNAQRTLIGQILSLVSYTKLQSFSIAGESSVPRYASFSEFLLSQPHLESLSIHGYGEWYYDGLLDAPVRPEGLLPRLSHLHIAGRTITRYVLGFLHQRIEKKMPPLEKLTVGTSGELFLVTMRSSFMDVAKTVTVVSEPIPQHYTPLNEVTIIEDGTLAFTLTPPSSPMLGPSMTV
ncbi:hypothetical protein H0H92_002625, partial [Tricholoma furcatifolium]